MFCHLYSTAHSCEKRSHTHTFPLVGTGAIVHVICKYLYVEETYLYTFVPFLRLLSPATPIIISVVLRHHKGKIFKGTAP